MINLGTNRIVYVGISPLYFRANYGSSFILRNDVTLKDAFEDLIRPYHDSNRQRFYSFEPVHPYRAVPLLYRDISVDLIVIRSRWTVAIIIK